MIKMEETIGLEWDKEKEIQKQKKIVSYASKVDPDQTSHLAASDLGLHYLPMIFLWVLGITGLNSRYFLHRTVYIYSRRWRNIFITLNRP